MSDDYSAGLGTTGSVRVGGSVTGEIEVAGDRDWIAVSLKAGRWYRMDVEGHDAGNGALENPANVVIYQQGDKHHTLETTVRPGSCFGPETDVTYYVEVAGREGDTGGYRLSVTEVADDFTAGTDTAGAVAVGGEVTGEMEHAGDRDWFAVTLEAGKTYRIDLKGRKTGDGTLADPNLGGVFDAYGRLIDGTWDDNGGAGNNGRVLFTATRSGVHYIEAGVETDWTAVDRSPWIGTYKLSVVEVSADAGMADTVAADAGAITVGGSVTGEIGRSSDLDWFAVTLEAGRSYIIDLKGKDTGDGTLEDPYLDGVYAADGNRIDDSWDYDSGDGRNSRTIVTVEEGGTHYVAAGASRGGTGTYTLSVAQELAANAGTTGAVAVGGSVRGEIERSSDLDWFAVTLEAGRPYIIDLKGKDTGDGTLEDPYLDGVFDADGNRIDYSWDYDGGEGRNSRETVTVEEGGTYYVAAGASGGGTGTYTVSVAHDPDLAADASTTGAVAVGGSVQGEIERRADLDWFAVTLEAGRSYVIDLKGKDTGDGTLEDPYLDGVYGADGNRIDGSWDYDGGEGRNSRTTVTVEEGGTYYVAAGVFGSGTGTYTVSVAEDPQPAETPAARQRSAQAQTAEPPDDFTADAGTTGTVAVGGSATGEIERAGDSDWFAVTLKAGRSYIIDVKGRPTRDGTLKNPYLDGVYDAGGTVIDGTWDDNGGEGRNSRTTVTVEEGGTYYVAAGAAGKHRGTYTLTVKEDPDLAADTGTTGTITVGGSVTGEIERVHDGDWFAVALKAGTTYTVELKGRPTRDGTLKDPYLDGIYDATGDYIGGTWDDNGGKGRNSLVTFTAEEDGVHYLAAGAAGRHTGTYTLSMVEDAM